MAAHTVLRTRRSPPAGRLTLALVGALAAGVAPASSASGSDALEAVVKIHAEVPATARTAATLGTERNGSGVVIDGDGLVLTIGYLILEALEVQIEGAGPQPVPASIVAYDHASGLGLVRAASDLEVEPAALGDSDALSRQQPVLTVSHVDELDVAGVYVVDRRDFAGYWEYLLEDAIFTSPPHREFGGAALFNEDGEVVGIGSLFVNDAAKRARPVPGNMFVPVNELKPILADLLATGRRSTPPRPWLGLYFEEHRGRVFVTRIAADGPGEAAGVLTDDLIVGVNGAPVGGLADFYRRLWDQGAAGIEISLDVLRGVEVMPVGVQSGDRYRWLRLNPTF